MFLRILLFLLSLWIIADIHASERVEWKFNSLSLTLKSVLKTDSDILRMWYSGGLLKRFDIYRAGILEEWKKKYQLIPNVWSKRPNMDMIYLYTPYIQKYPLSCEIASVRMILESLGKRKSEESIYRAIPRSPWVLSGWIWWDPDKEFVWSLTWTQWGRTGYGIYEKPLSDYIEKQWFNTEIINQDSKHPWMTPHKQLVYLLDKVKHWSHVILWWDWCTTPADEDGILQSGWRWTLHYFPLAAKNICVRSSEERKFSWKTTDNKKIEGLSGEHTFVLLWYIGAETWISHVIVWDTYTGRHIFSYDEWMRKWELMNYRSLRVEKI